MLYFWPLFQTRVLLNSRGFGVRGEKVMQMHACESEFGRKGGWVGGLIGNVLRRDESSWLCMKFEFAFFAGQDILIRALPPFFWL